MRKRILVIGAVVAVLILGGVVATLALSSHAKLDTNYTPMASGRIATAKHSMNSAVVASMKLSLESPAVNVPIEVVIPVIGVKSPLQAVGMTSSHAMSAPEGGAGSSDWSNTFWYRGSAVPGDVGTATIAGHIDDRFGDYAVRIEPRARCHPGEYGFNTQAPTVDPYASPNRVFYYCFGID